ncbi:hypothetical protein R6Q57_015600 [Mikania cordata]
MDVDSDMFMYDTNPIRGQMTKFVIQEGLVFYYFNNSHLTNMISEMLQHPYIHINATTFSGTNIMVSGATYCMVVFG